MLKFPAPFPATIFFCTKQRSIDSPKPCCRGRGSEKLRDTLKEMIRKEGLETRIRVFKSGCLGVCEQGPAAMTFPDGNLLMAVQPEDLAEILDQVRGE